MKTLRPEYQDLFDDFKAHYGSSCCSCHISPPCGYCTDEGNPDNLLETPEAWENNGDGYSEDEVASYV